MLRKSLTMVVDLQKAIINYFITQQMKKKMIFTTLVSTPTNVNSIRKGINLPLYLTIRWFLSNQRVVFILFNLLPYLITNISWFMSSQQPLFVVKVNLAIGLLHLLCFSLSLFVFLWQTQTPMGLESKNIIKSVLFIVVVLFCVFYSFY